MALVAEESLNHVFSDLKSKNKETRLRASYELLNHVNIAHRDLPSDKFYDSYMRVNSRVAQLVVTSTDPTDKIGGILAIEQLITFEGDDAAQKTTRFSGYLRAALRSNDNEVLVYAAQALGHLATPGGALTAELVESEIKSALEWLQTEPRQESRRFAAVLVIRELAKNSPTLLYPFVPQILDCIWSALRDIKVLIRETAAEAVGACFEIISARDSSSRQQWFFRMYAGASEGLKSNIIESVHGSLLVIKELLRTGGMFMNEYYREACEIVLHYKDHRDMKIRSEVVIIIPILAGYAPSEFSQLYLHKFMTHLQGQLKREKERSSAFIAIGKTANATGSAIAPYLDGILVSVRDGLSYKAKNRTRDGAVFECISMLSIAVGQTLTKYMEALMDPMFACGLSDALTQALVDMAHYIPPVKSLIQDKLLDLLSLVLSGRPFKPLGCPENRLPPIPVFAREWTTNGIEHRDPEIALALHTLGSFDFRGHVLNEFVRDVALPFVTNNSADIRKAAALTCCQLYIQDPIIHQTSFHAKQVVGQVISKLLGVGVGDPDPDIRRTVLQALGVQFDIHLAHPDNIHALVMAINETEYEVRQAAMIILGRLTSVNPAYVFPPLRKLLLNLMNGVRNSDDSTHEEEGAKLISLCISSAQQIVRPYVETIVKILIPKATDSNPIVASTVIRAIGDLSTVGGKDLLPYIPTMMPIIIDALQDLSSPVKRDSALRALGQLASNSGYVIKPYLDHPHLLDLLVNIIKTEQTGALRKETIKLLGILGALDPYKHQQIIETSSDSSASNEVQSISDVALIMQGLTPSNEEYYPTVVMNTLMYNVLKDNSLSQYHSAVIEAIVTIFRTLGLKCVPFLSQIVPTFVTIIRVAPQNRLDLYFNQLAILVSIVKQHIRPFRNDLVELIEEFWDVSRQVQPTVLSLIDALSGALEAEFTPSIVKILPLMMRVLDSDPNPQKRASEKILHTILVFGPSAEESMWLILPKLVRTFQINSNPVTLRKACIDTIGKISRQVNLSDYTGLLTHSLIEVFPAKEQVLRMAALDCICALVYQIGHDFDPYVDAVKKSLARSHMLNHGRFDDIVTRLRNGESLPQDLSPDRFYGAASDEAPTSDIGQRKLPVNQEHLKVSWEATQRSTRDDWLEWMRRFSVELLKESPSNALRACAVLASVYQPLAKDLFNAAFVSCWTELYDQYQEELVRSLELALTSPHIPPEILQVLLNLAEFMEHDDKPLPIDIGTLGVYAGKCHAYAKALHYKELEFEEEKTPSVVEALISINNQLQQTDAAVGILRNAQKYRDFELKETWFEKLGRWDEALQAYQTREREDPNAFDITMGKMRCLHALGEWDLLSNLAQEKWSLASIDHKRHIAPLAAAAAWGLGQWELMDNYLEAMKLQSTDRSFFGAILTLHQNQFPDALDHIERAREGLDTELSALLGESYTRAYGVVVRVQMLAELEEIITYKKSGSNPVKQATMRETWTKRLKGCERNVETWQRMLKVRALVLTPTENIDMWIKFANLCRKQGRIGLAEKSLRSLQNGQEDLDIDPLTATSAIPEVTYAQLKYAWTTGRNNDALVNLQGFTNNLSEQLASKATAAVTADKKNQQSVLNANYDPNANKLRSTDIDSTKKLLAKCYLKLGEWQTWMKHGDWASEHVHEILANYLAATQYNPNAYKAWHAWALANFEVVSAITSQPDRDASTLPQAAIVDHVVPAIQGFFESIDRSNSSSLQDTLRLLTLWFNHGADAEVNRTMVEGFTRINIDTWLEVIPQLIARINQSNPKIHNTIHRLLDDVGKAHPQALVYPLTVAMKSNVTRRSQSAAKIMQSLSKHSPKLVEQAELVSRELIRVAVLWHELWYEGLEEASRLYFGDHNIEGMFATLAPLHILLEDGPQTLREISFTQAFGRDLEEAKQWCDTYHRSHEVGDLNQAWDLYYSVFRRISRQLPQLMTLDLTYISPALKDARDLELAVPGTYQSGKPIVRISRFDQVFTVIPSKQRPRKMTLKGSDGQPYTYVCKGHEDIRQDERVMQLFGLVNTLLNNDTESFKRHLNIQSFPAIPLSQSSGLLGWVPNSDTLHNLIKDYRENRRILLNIEHRIMLQMAPDYDNLTLMQKVEVFSYAMDNTTGKDLYRVLWLKSKSSESWLERRTNYTRSLAVMSMVGYILGLGDRHPSNLMLDRITGKIIHIDFGDCFEVAMHREKYPERVPFRLTRMLTFAMEVSNIDGSYKLSCEAVMRVIRDNKESLMAVLEAFIHDPLLNWRLGNRESPPEPSFTSERRQSLMGDLETTQTNVRTGGGSYRARNRTSALEANSGAQDENRDIQNAQAVKVLARVKEKLTGRDFKPDQELDVEEQVAKLIGQATSVENLCQHYIGWCSFW
ncbi:phosphatidylinositol kinase- protein kinase tor1 [Xylographa vitiligo]|nr:phosphatidylinositol kinase- protein kinase tor1 [Xylographa vitiligo]